MGGTQSQMVWPPVILRTQILGEMRDTSGRNFPRDQGRSTSLGGKIFEIWGDTFCFDDGPREKPPPPVSQQQQQQHQPTASSGGGSSLFRKLASAAHNVGTSIGSGTGHGGFVGTTDNCISLVADPAGQPTLSTYQSAAPRVPQFIPYLPAERAWTDAHARQNWRIVLWSLGGIVEDAPAGCGRGTLFFGVSETHGAEQGPSHGMCVARVSLNADNTVRVQRSPESEPLFGPDEPHFGHPSPLVDDDAGYVYLLGHRDRGDLGIGGLRTALARVPRGLPFERRHFEFLQKNGGWGRQSDIDGLMGVLEAMGHGALFKCPRDAQGEHVFGPKGFPFVFVGVDKFLSSSFYLCVAERMEGPWHVENLGPLPKFLGERSNVRYCLYPHLWGSNLAQGELLISWTDNGQMGGINVMARVWFKMNDPPK